MRIKVDTHLRLDASSLPTRIVRSISDELTVTNPDRDRMRREHVWGWENVPKKIRLYEADGYGGLVLPRGYARRISAVADVEWEDARRTVPIDTSNWKVPNPKGQHQEKAMDLIHKAEQGIIQLPPGSGKTVAVLEGIRRAGQRALVIVDKTNIARQWQDRCEAFLGFKPGILGDGQWDDRMPITIALQQSLWSRRDELDAWWGRFGFVCLDECHHAAAHTYYDILQRFPAAWRIGVSATPHKQQGLEPFIDAVLGDTILDAPGDGVLVPEVLIVDTDFYYLFWPTHTLKPSGKCGFKYCTRSGKVHRNNYVEMVSDLENDISRNFLIAKMVVGSISEGRVPLVVSDRIRHLKRIKESIHRGFGLGQDSVLMLTGEQSSDRRMEIYERAGYGGLAVLSTIADEALDIPRLDTVHLVWPSRNTDGVIQRVGRIQRQHLGKKSPLIVDYRDRRVGILRSQGSDRDKLYEREGWPVLNA